MLSQKSSQDIERILIMISELEQSGILFLFFFFFFAYMLLLLFHCLCVAFQGLLLEDPEKKRLEILICSLRTRTVVKMFG
jgi:vacuolar-type H+-ATPase subunit I/STV1